MWKQNYFFQKKHEKCKLFLVALFLIVLATYSVGLYSINTSKRRQSKTLILSTNIDLRSLEIKVLIVVCRPTGNKWQSKTLVVAISDPRSLIVKRVFDCRLSCVETKLFFFKRNTKNVNYS